MHTRYTLVLSAILGGYLTNAAHHRGALITGALITPAPIAPGLAPRQELQCDADYTTCADSYGGCCPVGEPCTATSGVPFCGGDTCGAADPICGVDGCCDIGQECILSTGNYYCTGAGLVIPTYTAPVVVSVPTVTTVPDLVSIPVVTIPQVTIPEPSIDTSSNPTSSTQTPPTTTDEGSNTLVLPSVSDSTSSEVLIQSEPTGSGSSTPAAVTTSTLKAAGDAVSVAGPWTAGVLAWLTGLLMIA